MEDEETKKRLESLKKDVEEFSCQFPMPGFDER